MKGKRWVLLFLLIVFAGIGAYMALCWFVNPLGYFTNEKGLDYFDNEEYARKIKITYLYEHPDEVEAVTIGGSKSGSVDPSVMEELTGLKYYNFYMNVGNFADYVRYATFMAEKCRIKEITLVLSGFETEGYDRTEKGNAYRPAAILSGNPFKLLTERLSYLMTDLYTTASELKDLGSYNILKADCIYDGMRNRRSSLVAFKKNPDKVANGPVMGKKEKQLKMLFSESASSQTAREDNLEAMRQIKSVCEENGVNLRVIVGPSFILDKCRYECSEYYDYFEDLVRICGEVWDFSDYNAINMNPYNFYDRSHCTKEVSTLMLRTALSKEPFEGYKGFGQLLNADNVHEAMKERKAQYEHYKEEYERTGDVTLGTMEDDSFIPWPEEWVTPGMERSEAIQKAVAAKKAKATDKAVADDDEDKADDAELTDDL